MITKSSSLPYSVNTLTVLSSLVLSYGIHSTRYKSSGHLLHTKSLIRQPCTSMVYITVLTCVSSLVLSYGIHSTRYRSSGDLLHTNPLSLVRQPRTNMLYILQYLHVCHPWSVHTAYTLQGTNRAVTFSTQIPCHWSDSPEPTCYIYESTYMFVILVRSYGIHSTRYKSSGDLLHTNPLSLVRQPRTNMLYI